MPPPITRSSMSCLSRFKALPQTSIPFRPFTTSPQLSAIGPESPKFIEVPQPPQRQQNKPRDIKGTLPPPRNIFHRRSAPKTDESYFAATIPEPSHETEPKDDRIAWKRRMAASRRSNLKEGILELHERKRKHETFVKIQGYRNSKERNRRFYAPQREDERLTSPTITAATSSLQNGPIPDPKREARIAERAARVAAKEAARAEARREALHTLYMHAREFITTEKQLQDKIDNIFTDHPFGATNETNIWDAYGAPRTVQDMLQKVNKTQKTAVLFHEGPALITGQRLKRIGEELTGGKMED